MDIQDTKEQRQAFEAWCIQWNIASVFPLDDEGQYSDYNIHLLYCAWLQGQASKAQAVPECTWTKNEDGYFDASCSQSFVFSEPEDKPSSYEFTHCCFCGGKLIEVKEPNND